jgi:hypothetical protein
MQNENLSGVAKELARLAAIINNPRCYETITINSGEHKTTVEKLLRSSMGNPLNLEFNVFDPRGKARPDDFVAVTITNDGGISSWIGFFKNLRNGSSFSLKVLVPSCPKKLEPGDTSLDTLDDRFSKEVIGPWNDLYASWKEQKLTVDISRFDSTFSVFHSLIGSEPELDIDNQDRVTFKILAVWQFFMKLVRSVGSAKTLGLDHAKITSSYNELLFYVGNGQAHSFIDFANELLEHFVDYWQILLTVLRTKVEEEVAKKLPHLAAGSASKPTTTTTAASEDMATSLTRRINEIMPLLDPEAVNLVDNNFKLWSAEVNRGSASLSDNVIKRQAWLSTVASFPFKDRANYNSVKLQDAISSFNKSHYGMDDVKRALAEMLALKIHGISFSEVICLVGPPGTGKTTIARSLANSLNVPMRAIALGGIHDEAAIRGISVFYSGSSNGRIIEAMKSAAVKNPIILLDEIDKMSMGRGSPAAALLELLDPEQNSKFVDQYLGFPVDLREVFWITTANDVGGIPYELRNRMHMIEVPGYNKQEQLSILSDYLVSKYKENWKLGVTVDPASYGLFVSERTSGVRNMEHDLQRVLKSYLLDKELGNFSGDTITAEYVSRILKRREVVREPIGFRG